MPGILPYVQFNPLNPLEKSSNEAWVMISQEQWGSAKGQWDYFNGGPNPGETAPEAAAREGYEESLGLFGSIEQLKSKMVWLPNTPNGFILDVLDLKTRNDIVLKCTNQEYLRRKKWNKYQKACYQEKTEVRWVPLASLINTCVKDVGVFNAQGQRVLKNGQDELVIRNSLVEFVQKNQLYFGSLVKYAIDIRGANLEGLKLVGAEGSKTIVDKKIRHQMLIKYRSIKEEGRLLALEKEYIKRQRALIEQEKAADNTALVERESALLEQEKAMLSEEETLMKEKEALEALLDQHVGNPVR